MKILLTHDLHHPACPERANTESLLRLLWDQLQAVGNSISVETLVEQPHQGALDSWMKEASSLTKYRTMTPSPLHEYALIIGVDLPAGAEALFTSLGIKTLIIRSVPCSGFNRFVLVRANFEFPQEFCTTLPILKNLCTQDNPASNISSEDRNWWLFNRFLLNQGKNDPTNLFVGTTMFQPERIRSGSLINLATYADEIMEMLYSCPNFYYCSRHPQDHSEVRFMKQIGTTCPSLDMTVLLARNEFHILTSIDSGMIPVAAAFEKKITILGTQPTWLTMKIRSFCDIDFISRLCT